MCLVRFQTKNEHAPLWFTRALTTLILSCACVPSHAEQFLWVPSLSQRTVAVSEDLELSLRARTLLLQDQVLAGQLLGISVRNRVATLWGNVSSPSMARRAEECLRHLPGVAAVRNELSIDRSEDLASLPQVSPTGRVPGALVHRAGEQSPATLPEFSWRPAGSSRPEALPESAGRLTEYGGMPAQPQRESIPGFPSNDSTRIIGQSAVGTLPLPRVKTEVTTPGMPAPTLSPGRSASAASPPMSNLAQAIDALRLADERFHGIRVEVRGDTVYLRGTVFRWEHLFELARSIAVLPGVKKVLFEGVRAEIGA